MGQWSLRDTGSSPHTRGAPGREEPGSAERRIIPAYAGSTASPHRTPRSSEDHPRIRGEHRALNPGGVFSAGSSPHTRGALRTAARRVAASWIIPAYAGSTGGCWPESSKSRDHPRIRGEHTYANMEQESILGSSPHTRGARGLCRLGGELPGIIPAYAGSTGSRRSAPPRWWDHPRIRGEHGGVPRPRGAPDGSSPHTRGALAASLAVESTEGIIPAYAGSTEECRA